jgi:cyanophycinase
VYVVDGEKVTHSNVAEAETEATLAMHNVIVHVLAEGDMFDLRKRLPTPASSS